MVIYNFAEKYPLPPPVANSVFNFDANILSVREFWNKGYFILIAQKMQNLCFDFSISFSVYLQYKSIKLKHIYMEESVW